MSNNLQEERKLEYFQYNGPRDELGYRFSDLNMLPTVHGAPVLVLRVSESS